MVDEEYRDGVWRGSVKEGLIKKGVSCNWWGAQRRLSFTSTVFYNVEDVEKVCLEGVSKGC